MSRNRQAVKIFTVIDVMCGVGVGAKSFLLPKPAQAYMRRLRRGRNLDEDDVQLFEDTLVLTPKHRGVGQGFRPRSPEFRGRRRG
jgi:hypothetical protein